MLSFKLKKKYIYLTDLLKYRAAVVWVNAILMKQIDRRECFDVEHLMRHLLKVRPGAFTDLMSFFVTFALAFRIASLGGWSVLSVGQFF